MEEIVPSGMNEWMKGNVLNGKILWLDRFEASRFMTFYNDEFRRRNEYCFWYQEDEMTIPIGGQWRSWTSLIQSDWTTASSAVMEMRAVKDSSSIHCLTVICGRIRIEIRANAASTQPGRTRVSTNQQPDGMKREKCQDVSRFFYSSLNFIWLLTTSI